MVAKPTKYMYLTLDLRWSSPYIYIAPWFQTKFFKGLIRLFEEISTGCFRSQAK